MLEVAASYLGALPVDCTHSTDMTANTSTRLRRRWSSAPQLLRSSALAVASVSFAMAADPLESNHAAAIKSATKMHTAITCVKCAVVVSSSDCPPVSAN